MKKIHEIMSELNFKQRPFFNGKEGENLNYYINQVSIRGMSLNTQTVKQV